jgi:hypothetical protein
VNVFAIVGRYFWLLCLGITAFNYFSQLRDLASKDPGDPRSSAEAITLRRRFAVISALPWVVMGWGIVFGGVPNVWYYFRPQDLNPYVWTWFASMFLIALCFACWVFLRDGAEKMVMLEPFPIGSTTANVKLTARRVKLFAALGPPWIVAWVYLASLMDAHVPK